jgi:cold shock CspA family protein
MDNLELRMVDVPDREAVEALVHTEAEKLERHTGSVTSCKVAIEQPHAHPTSGAQWRARIEVRLAGADPFVVRREPNDGDTNDPLSKVVRDAFAAADRRARELKRQMRGEQKQHPGQQMHAIVIELHPEEDYGLLYTMNGRKVYFHRNSLAGFDFEALREGMGVAFEEVEGDEGPQASTVRVIDSRSREGRLDERTVGD